MPKKPFSEELSTWITSDKPKTLGSLEAVFAEKSFAIIFLVLMFFPALPLPTGGITHVFELITMLVALEMIAGRRTIWLPKRWQKLHLSKSALNRALPFMARRIRWFERFARPRLSDMLRQRDFLRLVGLIVFLLALAAFLAPPFSGLDTLPALGAVIIALALILDDAVVLLIGLIVGIVGVGVELTLGSLVVHFFQHFF